ncbi:putative methyltransferase YcgJ (plasmid) [Pseudosulfitobacter pseudonitzschiae]|uniref:Putative methyltransferase YcgJ n=1 Tax=Pseudosulfitobacter pseudonitzschiae TaxID=1402135 RepID=A0A221K8Z5_9RHOB|nr:MULTISPECIES: class I SAM-dependent methyltransferase [Roseobacteraceae]ASM75449.1 putative methyltransferase YcgJ [Pseudosulfitobacter pseudonitzschiae]
MPPSPRFWNWIARRYSRQPVADEAAYRRKLEITQSYLRPDMRVLEFGCGTGTTALIHAPHVASIDAIDFSDRMIGIAREKAQVQGARNVNFEVARIEDWPATDGNYDAVLGLSVLHLLEDPCVALSKVHCLLKPGGIFVSSTVCLADMQGIARRLLPVGHALGLLPLVRPLSAEGLAADLRGAGFSIDHQWRPAPDKAVFIVAIWTEDPDAQH